MKVVYESADGKQFGTENDCLMHEAALGITDFMLFDEAGVPITTLEDCPTSPKYAIVRSNPDVAKRTIRTHFGGMGISGCGYYIRKNGIWIHMLNRIKHYRDLAHKLQTEYLYLRALEDSILGELVSYQPNQGEEVSETGQNTLARDAEAVRASGPGWSHLPIRIKPSMRELFEEYRQMREEQEQAGKEEDNDTR